MRVERGLLKGEGGGVGQGGGDVKKRGVFKLGLNLNCQS